MQILESVSYSSLKFTIHIVSKEGLVVNSKKIKFVMEWLTLKNVVEVRSFMGLEGYYKIFIKGFCNIGYPFTALQKKGKKFE